MADQKVDAKDDQQVDAQADQRVRVRTHHGDQNYSAQVFSDLNDTFWIAFVNQSNYNVVLSVFDVDGSPAQPPRIDIPATSRRDPEQFGPGRIEARMGHDPSNPGQPPADGRFVLTVLLPEDPEDTLSVGHV